MSKRPPPSKTTTGASDASPESGERVRIEPISRTAASTGATRAEQRGGGPSGSRAVWSSRWLLLGGAAAVVVGLLALAIWGGGSTSVEPSPPGPQSGASGAAPAGAGEPDALQAPPSAVAPGGAKALAASRGEAARLLGEFQALSADLAPHAERWAPDAYEEAQVAGRRGEDALIGGQPEAAIAHLEDGLGRLRELKARTPQAFSDALTAGESALADADGVRARQQYELALAIEPDDPRAQRGLARVETLGPVLAEMETGGRHERAGEWQAARDAFARALEFDADWRPAHSALARVETQLADIQFKAHLSDGFQELAAGQLNQARKSLQAALALRPNSQEARAALGQVEEAARLDAIARAQRAGRAAESREDWAEAVRQYEAALALDSGLSFAIEGLARSRERRALDERLDFLLADPARLYSATALREAQGLAAVVADVSDPGPRLLDQRARLEASIARAATPISVAFESDSLTDVTIVQVRRLGTFDRLQLDLRPGTYVVTGSRRGYRDVRQTLTLIPGTPTPTVVVRCTETI